MSLTSKDVQKIAHLARLSMDDNSCTKYTTQLSSIFDFIAQMEGINTETIKPLSHPFELSQPLREDVVTEPNERSKFQAIAPMVDAGLYLVPKVIDEE